MFGRVKNLPLPPNFTLLAFDSQITQRSLCMNLVAQIDLHTGWENVSRLCVAEIRIRAFLVLRNLKSARMGILAKKETHRQAVLFSADISLPKCFSSFLQS
uniref:Uncharacterized protein n=1 Tax=Micrurus surinamensis TaxID=129470 RepID=A0A2D4NR51_MICSU